MTTEEEAENLTAQARQVMIDKINSGDAVIIDVPMSIGDDWWPVKVKLEGGGIWRWAE